MASAPKVGPTSYETLCILNLIPSLLICHQTTLAYFPTRGSSTLSWLNPARRRGLHFIRRRIERRKPVCPRKGGENRLKTSAGGVVTTFRWLKSGWSAVREPLKPRSRGANFPPTACNFSNNRPAWPHGVLGVPLPIFARLFAFITIGGNYRQVSSYRQLSSALPVLKTGIHRRRLGR